MTARALPILLLAVTLGGCDVPPGGGGDDVCISGGVTYHPGDSFPSPDGCNSCACAAGGQIACTARACAVTCTYDGQTRLPGESFPSTDGCNTCICGESGQVACTKRACVAGTQWLTLLPKQCRSNAWERVTSKGDGAGPAYPDPELLSIDNFFEDQGVDLVELGLLQPDPMIGTCGSCDCPRGDRLVVRARSADAATLTAKYGFTAIGAEEALGYSPKQCTNPWPPAAKPAEEVKNVQGWAGGLGAALMYAGFAYPTEVVTACLSCNCARGDRLVTYPKAAAGAAKLKQAGFTALPIQ